MGKVLDKLSKLASVKSLTEAGGNIHVVLADGYANEGKVETVVQTAHAARLFIQGASDGTTPARRQRQTRMTDDGEVLEEVPVRNVPRYPGLPEEMRRPLYEMHKGYSPTEAEGRDAFTRGFEKDSHGYGESAAARDFENSWESERQRQKRIAEMETPIESYPDAGDAGEVTMFLNEVNDSADLQEVA